MRKFAVAAAILLLGCLTAGSVSASLNDGLVAYFPFNGNANDESGTGNNGIVHNASLTSDRFGNPNSAYSFAGNAYIQVPNSPSLSFFDEFSFSLWFKASVLSEEVLLAKSGDRTGLGIKQHDVGTIGIENGQFYSGLHAIYAGTVAANEWHMVTVTTGGGMIRAYLDASLQSEETREAFNLNPAMVNEDLYLGMGPVAWYYYHGVIDDVRVYNRALTEAEIQQLYSGVHLPSKPVPSVGVGEPMLDFGVSVSWAKFPHNGTDYSSNLSDEVKSIGTGIVHAYTKPDANRFGSIDPDGNGPAIWIRYKVSTGEPIYVLYGHTATSWNDQSSWSKKKFNFNCSYSIQLSAGDKVFAPNPIGLTAPFYHGGVQQDHLHLSVFKPAQKADGTYYGPPTTGWGYSPLVLSTNKDLAKYGALGTYVDPDDFFANYYLSDDIQ